MRGAWLCLLALLSSGLAACAPSGAPSRPRNLLILCVDTLRADQLGAYGQTPSITPALDRLAAESVVFEQARAAASWTLPSVGAVFTSLPPSATNLWTFESRLSEGCVTLAELFRQAGYRTHGVASHVFFDPRYGLLQGFESFDSELAHRKGEAGWREVTSPLVAERGRTWIEARGAETEPRPWVLFLHFFDPHLPYMDHEAADPADESRDEFQRYRSEIAWTDHHVENVLAALQQSGQAEDTAILFFSDHGEAFGEHPGVSTLPGRRGVWRHSYSLYEEELRVPLFLYLPGVEPRRISSPVRTVDLLPTLVQLFGLADTDPARRTGRSLLPLLRGETLELPPLLAEIRLKDGHHASALVRGDEKLIENLGAGTTGSDPAQADARARFELYRIGPGGDGPELASRAPEQVEALADELHAQVAAAEALGADLEAAPVEHSAEDLQHLQDLGYSGTDEPR